MAASFHIPTAADYIAQAKARAAAAAKSGSSKGGVQIHPPAAGTVLTPPKPPTSPANTPTTMNNGSNAYAESQTLAANDAQAAAAANPAAPYLTPQQQQALNQDTINYQYSLSMLTQQAANARAQAAATLAGYQKQHDLGIADANDSMAARGLFMSSIRDTDLNDINSTLATRSNILSSSLNSQLAAINDALTKLNGTYGNQQAGYYTDAVGNAQSQTPVLPPTGPTMPSTPPAATPNPVTTTSTTPNVTPGDAANPNVHVTPISAPGSSR